MSEDPSRGFADWVAPGHQPAEDDSPATPKFLPAAQSAPVQQPAPPREFVPARQPAGPVSTPNGGPGAYQAAQTGRIAQTARPPRPGTSWQAPRWHQPGIVPLRRLTLGDIFNGAFAVYRNNPRPAIVLPLLVSLIGFLVAAPLVYLGRRTWNLFGTEPFDDVGAVLGSLSSTLLGALTPAIVAAGLVPFIALTVYAAALGEKPTIAQLWQRVRPRLLRYLGLILLLGVAQILACGLIVGFFALGQLLGSTTMVKVLPAVVLTVLVLIGWIWLAVRLSLSPVVLVVERQPVFASLARSFRLTRGGFWGILAAQLCAQLVVSIISQVLGTIMYIAGALAYVFGDLGLSDTVLMTEAMTLTSLLSNALTCTFSTGVLALLHLNRRIVVEGYDVELLRQAGQREAAPGVPTPAGSGLPQAPQEGPWRPR